MKINFALGLRVRYSKRVLLDGYKVVYDYKHLLKQTKENWDKLTPSQRKIAQLMLDESLEYLKRKIIKRLATYKVKPLP